MNRLMPPPLLWAERRDAMDTTPPGTPPGTLPEKPIRRPTGARETMNSADPRSKNTTEKVQQGDTTTNPNAKVPSDLYPDPPGVTEHTPGAPDD
jgi:hypothetical protein